MLIFHLITCLKHRISLPGSSPIHVRNNNGLLVLDLPVTYASPPRGRAERLREQGLFQPLLPVEGRPGCSEGERELRGSRLPERGMCSWHRPTEGHGGVVPWRLSPWGFGHTSSTSTQTYVPHGQVGQSSTQDLLLLVGWVSPSDAHEDSEPWALSPNSFYI